MFHYFLVRKFIIDEFDRMESGHQTKPEVWKMHLAWSLFVVADYQVNLEKHFN